MACQVGLCNFGLRRHGAEGGAVVSSLWLLSVVCMACTAAAPATLRVLEALLRRHAAEGDYHATACLSARIVRRCETDGDSAPGVAESLWGMLGTAFWQLKRFHRAAESFEQQLAIAQRRGAREPQIQALEKLALCCVDLRRDEDALRYRHKIYELVQQGDDVGKQVEALTELGATFLRRGTMSCKEFDTNCGYTGAVNAFTTAIDLSKRTGDSSAAKKADCGMQATYAAMSQTARETGIPIPLLMLGEPDGGGEEAAAAAAAWPQITHDTDSRRGDGQEKGALELGDWVAVHSLKAASEHNGKLGVLVGFISQSGRWTVELQALAGAGRQHINVKPANLERAALAVSHDAERAWEAEQAEGAEGAEGAEDEGQGKQGEDDVLTPAKKEANQRQLQRHLRMMDAVLGGDGTLSLDEFVGAMTSLDISGKSMPNMDEEEAEGAFAVFKDQVELCSCCPCHGGFVTN